MVHLNQVVKMKISLLEDDATLTYTIKRYFEQKGHEVQSFSLLRDALFNKVDADLYLVDISLPDGEGYTYAKKIRENSEAPIIFLSVRDDQKSLLSGFNAGADDYLTKPFTFEELDLRIKALFKRVDAKHIRYHDLLIETDIAKVSYKSQEINLSVQEYRMMLLLMQNKNDYVTRKAFNTALNIDEGIQDNTLNVAMGRLRKKLLGIAEIEMIRKQGYRLKL